MLGVLSANMFLYCENDPVNKVDPTGYCPWHGDDAYSREKRYSEGCGARVSVAQLMKAGFQNVTNSMMIRLNMVIDKYRIRTNEALSHFLSQSLYESTYGTSLTEAGYIPDAAAREAYLQSKSYYPYYGAGYIQLSRAVNYEAFATAMNDPRIYSGKGSPEYVAARYAWEASGFWWRLMEMNTNILDRSFTQYQVSRAVYGGDDDGSFAERAGYYRLCSSILWG